jgi:hypothetical protein
MSRTSLHSPQRDRRKYCSKLSHSKILVAECREDSASCGGENGTILCAFERACCRRRGGGS